MNEIKKYYKELCSGIKIMFKEFFNKNTNKKQRANMWTFSRLIVSFIIPTLTLLGSITLSSSLFISAIGVTVFGAITDFFDGRSARKYNSYSEFGKLLDQVVDKVFSIMIGISLSILNPLFIINLLGESIISCVNISYHLKYKDIKKDSLMLGKIKQWPLGISFVLGFISTIVPGLSTITNISILITLLFQISALGNYIISNKKEVERINAKIKNNQIENEAILSTNEKKVNNTYTINNERIKDKKQEYINLRNILNNISYLKQSKIDNDEKITDDYKIQKIKNDFN